MLYLHANELALLWCLVWGSKPSIGSILAVEQFVACQLLMLMDPGEPFIPLGAEILHFASGSLEPRATMQP